MINPIQYLAEAAIVASGATFVFIVLEKWKVIELFQLYRSAVLPRRLHALPDCVFCMLFWLCVILAVPLALISNIFYIALPIFATPIAKAIYENCRASRIK